MKKLIIVFSFILIAGQACVKDSGYHDVALADKTYPGNTYEYLKSKPGIYDSLLLVIDRLGLKQTVSDSSITLFAVTNPSFQLVITNLNNLRNKADKLPLYLFNVDYNQLDTMVCQYIIKGKVGSKELSLQDGLNLFSVRYDYPMHGKLTESASSGYVGGGPEMINFSNTNRSQFVSHWITTTTGSNNVKTSNGIVHIITPDHVFGFNQFVSRLTYVPPPADLFTTIGGTLTASLENGGGPNAGEASKRVIDRDPYTKFMSCCYLGGWLKFELNTASVAEAYTIMSANDFESRDPKSWTIEGSNDNQNWTYLDSRSEQVFTERYMERVYRFENKKAFKYYRITFTEMLSGSDLQLAEWSMNLAK